MPFPQTCSTGKIFLKLPVRDNDNTGHRIVIDRAHADKDDFHAASPRKHSIPLKGEVKPIHLTVYYDRCVVEVFADDGRYLASDLVFPVKPYDRLQVSERSSDGRLTPLELQVSHIRSVWR
jgi:sucrose-6-phosphate hydrolase SacC (GH32 family)